jgi:hypothetical protein
MVRKVVPRAPKDEGRKFYNRRRTGIDRKVRTLITGVSNDYGVEMNVTIVYEYADEVSFFRSHGDEGNSRWFSSFEELVSAPGDLILNHVSDHSKRAACAQGTSTDMGVVDQATIELIKWQSRQPVAPNTPPAQAARIKKELTEDIMNSMHPSMLGTKEEDDRRSQIESDDDGNSDEESHNEDTDSSDGEVQGNYLATPKTPSPRERHRAHTTVPDVRHLSPKRRRTDDDIGGAVQYQSSPIMYPSYNTYQTSGPQLHVPGQHLNGQIANLGNYPLQSIGQSMSLLPQNDMGNGPADPFGSYEIPSMTQDYSNPGFQPEQLQNLLPVRNRHAPDVPQAKKAKAPKSSIKARTSSRRRKTTQ